MPARHSIEAIVFDLDDTLWPIAPDHPARRGGHGRLDSPQRAEVGARWDVNTLKLLRASLIAANPALRNDVMALRRGTIFAAFEECGGSADQAETAFAVFRDARQQVTFYPDALPALRRLAARFRLGVISNGFANVHAVVSVSTLKPSFPPMRSAFRNGRAHLRACIERMALPASKNALRRRRPENDVVGPARAGLKTAWINRSGDVWPETVGGSHSPTATFGDLDTFANWMLEPQVR